MSNVCEDQKTMNKAVRKAVNKVIKENRPSTFSRMLSMIIYIILIMWAFILALKVPENMRQLHVVLALVFAPFYILSYYLNSPKYISA
jgi:hypothetical protein